MVGQNGRQSLGKQVSTAGFEKYEAEANDLIHQLCVAPKQELAQMIRSKDPPPPVPESLLNEETEEQENANFKNVM